MKTAPKKGHGAKPKNPDEAIASILAQAEQIGRFVKMGMGMTDASRAAGVNPRTFYSWIEKAKAGRPGYDAVLEKIETDRAQGQAVLVQRVIKASESDWKAASWILERRHPETWAKSDSLNLTGKIGLEVGKLSDQDLESQIEATEQELKQLEANRVCPDEARLSDLGLLRQTVESEIPARVDNRKRGREDDAY